MYRLCRHVCVIIALTAASSAEARDCQDGFLFAAPAEYDVGDFTTGIDAADLDGDGFVDVAVANRNSNDVSVLMNAGDGTFAPAVHYAVGLEPRYVVAADFDGDGAIDLATADRGSHTVTVLVNAGDGTFALHATIASASPTWLIVADVDGDLDADILVTETGGGQMLLTVLENDGTGSFTRSGSVPTGIQPRGGDVADVNGDGKLDVLVANNTSNDVSVLLNDGDGGFVVADVLAAGEGPRYVGAADFDRDGDVDFAVIHKTARDLWVFRNDGAAQFSTTAQDVYPLHTSPHGLEVADLNGDGDLDLIACNVGATWIDVLHNEGGGSFWTQSVATDGGGAHIVAADVEPDGDLDLVLANKNDAVLVFANDTPQFGARSIIYVDASAAPGGDGRSWDGAFLDLDSALAPEAIGEMTPPVQIWIASGSYLPSTPSTDRIASFPLPPGVSVYGHFTGCEQVVDDRDLGNPSFTTTLTGDLLGDDGVEFANRDDNAYHVVTADLTAAVPAFPETVLDGLTVTGGSADDGRGGSGLDVTIPAGHTLRLSNCLITDNRSSDGGAGLRVTGPGSIELVDCLVTANEAVMGGGGVSIEGQAQAALTRRRLAGNDAAAFGGGVSYDLDGGALVLTDVVFSGNTAGAGGGLYADGAETATDPVISRVVFNGNEADIGGGARLIGGNPFLVNRLFSNNTAATAGGAVSNDDASPILNNVTFDANATSAGDGGTVHSRGTASAPSLVSCIVRGNEPARIVDAAGASTTASFSNVAGGWPGAGNIDADPLFVDPDGADDDPSTDLDNDYALGAGSPGIDVGDNVAVPAEVTVDLAGDPRFVDDPGTPDGGNWDGLRSMVDMGAYERQCAADLDGDGLVGFTDLLAVLSNWGPCAGCPEDLDGSGTVGFSDLLAVLSVWGTCG